MAPDLSTHHSVSAAAVRCVHAGSPRHADLPPPIRAASACSRPHTCRLGSEYCSPQGKYEPSLCPPGTALSRLPRAFVRLRKARTNARVCARVCARVHWCGSAGYFCPNFTSVLPCPEGHYCLRGSTEPAPCPLLASCPPLTVRRREYGGIVLTLGLDVLMLLILMYMKFVWEPRAVNRDRGRGVMEPSVSLRDALHATGEGTDLMAHGMEAGFGSVHASPTLAQSTNDLEKALLRASDAEAPLAAPIDAPHDVALPRVPSFRELGSLDTLKDGFRRCNAGLRLDVRFDDLGYTLPPPLNKTILSDVSGHIRPGRVTAVMGPSGAGKTTFMSVLMGKVNRTSGTLRINGAADEMYRYKTICGYVPQVCAPTCRACTIGGDPKARSCLY
ncbi:ATP-binding cassette domain-containing protein, partial [archaeon]